MKNPGQLTQQSFLAQNSFAGGVIDPLWYGQTNSDFYSISLKTGTNVDISPGGSISTRPGTKYISRTKTSLTTRLITFQPSISEGYSLEFGNLYVRFYLNGTLVVDGSNNPIELVTPYVAADLAKIQPEQLSYNLYIACDGYYPQVITLNKATATFKIQRYDTNPGPSIEDGQQPETTVTAGATTGTAVTFTAGSSVFLASAVGRHIINLQDTGDAIITSVSGTTCVADIVQAFPDTTAIPSTQWKLNGSPITPITPSAITLGAVITLTTVDNAFFSTDVGNYISVQNGIVQITVYNSATSVSGVVLKKLVSTNQTTVWSLEQPEWTAARGYPVTVCAYEQRLFWARKLTIWGTAIGLYNDFGVLASNDSAIIFNIAQKHTSDILWISNSNNLMIGTTSGILSIGNDSGMITATTPGKLANQTNLGCANIPAVQLNESLYAVSKDRKRLYLIKPNQILSQYYLILDKLEKAAHYTRNTQIVQIAVSTSPYRRIFAVLADGTIIVGTIMDQPVGIPDVAWRQYTTQGKFTSISVVSRDGLPDDIYVVAKRDVLASTVVYGGSTVISSDGFIIVSGTVGDSAVEVFESHDGTFTEDIYSDCSILSNPVKSINSVLATLGNPIKVFVTSHGYSTNDHVQLTSAGPYGTELNPTTYVITVIDGNSFTLNGTTSTTSVPTAFCRQGFTTVAELDHLNGLVVQVKADGVQLADNTPVSGSITLNTTHYTATGGLSYPTTIETLQKELMAGQQGSFIGQNTRMSPILYVYNSIIPTVGNDLITSQTVLDTTVYAPPLYSETLRYNAQPWAASFTLLITSTAPLPVRLLGIFGNSEGNLV